MNRFEMLAAASRAMFYSIQVWPDELKVRDKIVFRGYNDWVVQEIHDSAIRIGTSMRKSAEHRIIDKDCNFWSYCVYAKDRELARQIMKSSGHIIDSLWEFPFGGTAEEMEAYIDSQFVPRFDLERLPRHRKEVDR